MNGLLRICEKEISIIKVENAWQGFMTARNIPLSAPRRCHGLLYVISGKCEYSFENGDVFTVKTGDVFYLAMGAQYEMCVSSERYDFMAINFLVDTSELFLSEDFGRLAECEKQFCRAVNAWSQKGMGYMTETLMDLCGIYLQVLKNSQLGYVRSESRKKIDSACEYMREHCTDSELSIIGVSRRSGLSDAHFRRLFVKYMGISPQKYLINLKIDRAKELLALEWLTVSEIAEQSGFSDFAYFSRLFKNYTGTSPLGYRRQFLNEV